MINQRFLKYRIAIILVFLTMVFQPFAEIAYASEDGELSPVAISSEALDQVVKLDDSDELLQEYMETTASTISFEPLYSVGSSESTAMVNAGASRRKLLTKNEKAVYDELLTRFEKVADGSLTDTNLRIQINKFYSAKSYTASQLDLSYIRRNGNVNSYLMDALLTKGNINLKRVFNALLYDVPYTLYWYDKTRGTEYDIEGLEDQGNSSNVVYLSDDVELVLSLSVASSYSANGTRGTYKTNATKVSAAKKAAAAAKAIVERARCKSDYDKLCYYIDRICMLVSYDYKAAEQGTAYGDPWQLIHVFDGAPGTNVVCEGYSKAFKFLCDLTDFNTDIECYISTGEMSGGTGAGLHMWNTVKMDDGKSYMVDITNCDSGTPGYPNKLFLAGYNVEKLTRRYNYFGTAVLLDAYIFNVSGYEVMYTYDTGTMGLFTEAERNLSDQKYTPTAAAKKENHVWDSGVQVKKPTENTQGMVRYTCTICEKTRTASIPKLEKHNHSFTRTKAVSPTRFKTGNKEYYTCLSCKKVYADKFGIKETTVKAMTLAKLPEPSVRRVHGSNRYNTAFATAIQYRKNDGAYKLDSIIITCGDRFPDALSATYLSKIKKAPIVLVDAKNSNTVKRAQNFINKNVYKGGKVFIVGGNIVVPASMDRALRNNGYSVKRLAGKDRYETNLAVLQYCGIKGGELLVAEGNKYANALIASATGRPVLLSLKNGLTTNQKNFIRTKKADIKKITIVGNKSTISNGVQTSLAVYCKDIKRISESSADAMSAEVAKRYYGNATSIYIATGGGFADALSGGALSIQGDGPILLVTDKSRTASKKYADSLNLKRVVIIGGKLAVSENTARNIAAISSKSTISETKY